MRVRLLGRPSIEHAGVERRVPGRKAWALLAYLVLEPRAPSRRELAERLWSQADDPLAAARWALHQVRRAIAPDAEIEEHDGRLVLVAPIDLVVDAGVLLSGSMDPEEVEDVVRGELLEGFTFDDSPGFETWLGLQRARIASAATDALRWAATMLARREPPRALALLERGTLAEPFDDGLHELAIDIHVSRGDRDAGEAYLQQVDATYRRELGIAAPETLRRPLDRPAPPPAAPLIALDAEARALLDSARTRLEAGDYEGSLRTARRAASDAAASGDRPLEARALTMLAQVLIHSLRGRDRESLGLLARALQLASEVGDKRLVADIEREMGYVAFLDLRYGAAEAALNRSIAHAERVPDQRRAAKAMTYLAMCQSDQGDFDDAERRLRDAAHRLQSPKDRAWRAYALASLARVLLLTGRYADAREVGQSAVAIARDGGSLSVLPWCLIYQAEAMWRQGDPTRAREIFSEAFTLGCEMEDRCWEGLSLRGLALLEAEGGRRDRAVEMLEDALVRCRRLPDTYKWAEAVILTDLVELEGGADEGHVQEALSLTFRAPLADLAERLAAATSSSQTLPQTLPR